MTQADLDEERRYAAQTDQQEGKGAGHYSDEYLEKLALYRRILNELIHYHVLLCHGSVIALNGKAYMFTAKSGTGKTTHTKLWLKNIPGSYVLNGDKPLLLFKEDGVYACGTPWQGKENYGTNAILPLEAICILERDANNSVEPISFEEAIKTLVTQCYHADGSIHLIDSMKLIGKLSQIKLYRLKCNMDDEAALICHRIIAEE